VWNEAAASQRSLQDAAELVLEPEAKTIEDRYGFHSLQSGNGTFNAMSDPFLQSRLEEIKSISEKCQAFRVMSLNESALRKEQERELSPEAEEERQVERPPHMEPAKHFLHPDLIRMVQQGRLDCSSPAFSPAFKTIQHTSAVNHFDLETWPEDLLVTVDFEHTVQRPKHERLDEFLRPVQWILSCATSSAVVISSPYEANSLLADVVQQGNVVLRVYCPQISTSTARLDHLNFCPLPGRSIATSSSRIANQILQLNVFVGQLYFKDYEAHIDSCRYLGCLFYVPTDEIDSFNDGFVMPSHRDKVDEIMTQECPFLRSPIGMLRTLTSLRRKGQGFERSHIGAVWAGKLTLEHEFS